MNSNQTSKEICQEDSPSFDKDKTDFWEKVSNEKFVETVNPDFEPTLTTQNSLSETNEDNTTDDSNSNQGDASTLTEE